MKKYFKAFVTPFYTHPTPFRWPTYPHNIRNLNCDKTTEEFDKHCNKQTFEYDWKNPCYDVHVNIFLVSLIMYVALFPARIYSTCILALNNICDLN